jgi:uncharacterized protein (DUF924 family)
LALAQRPWAAELLYVWFRRLRPGDWFGSSPRVDAELRRRFARELAMLSSRPAQEFLSDPRTALAAVLLFDQLPRNLFRNSPQAHATDPLARAITHGALARGLDKTLTRRERQFLAMPLMYSEAIADQRLSLRYFAALGPGHGHEFARSHHLMIARFGRFPHRNRVLGRKSTPAEERAVEAGFHW